jgi:hypothetical protein
MSYSNVIDDIVELPHTRAWMCDACGSENKAYVLDVYAACGKCERKAKMRGYAAIGGEVEDVVDAVLAWMGTGADFDNAMLRKSAIDSLADSRDPSRE